MSKVGIVGFGIVGKSIAAVCSMVGVEWIPFDLNFGSREEINACDVVFVCVPTLLKEGGIDLSAIEDVFSWLKAPLVVIKSTVPVGTTRELQRGYKHGELFRSPEFLREKHWLEDAINETRVIFGARKLHTADSPPRKLLEKLYPDCWFHWVFSEEAEMCKIMLNSFLATKVTFANEIKQICDRAGVDYVKVGKLLLTDSRVGKSHLDVTKEGGFGGKCFPQDLGGLIGKAEELGYDARFLKEVARSNKRFRKDA